MIKNLKNIKEYLILAIVFLFPLTFAGTFVDQLALPKLIVLWVLILVVFLVIGIHVYFSEKVEIPQSKFDLPILLIVLSYLLSSVIVTANKAEGFFVPGTGSFVIGFGIVYFLVNTIVDKNKIKQTLIASATFIAFLLFLSFLGVLDKILPDGFNPTGDYLTGSIFLIVAVPFSVYFLIKESDLLRKVIYAISLVFILVSVGVSIFTLLSGSKKIAPLLPPFQTSWAVAVNTIRENPLLGIGPGNYLTAFNRFRPTSYNMTSLWNQRFTSGRNLYLTILTETGILGLIGIMWLLTSIIKNLNKSITIYKESRSIIFDHISFLVLVGLLVTFVVFPGTPVSFFLLFVVLALNSGSKIKTITLAGHNYQTVRILILLGIIISIIFVGFKAGPILVAESDFKTAISALNANDGKKTYDYLQKAITQNPYVDRYHAYYAQVNLALARSIAGSVKDTNDLTDEQKNLILQLIQQAIREAQNTVSLNLTRSGNWQVLANIYQVIIPYAGEADKFAIQSYNQTINLDNVDPNLRIALGGLYYSLGQYDNAINAFQLAASLKPDLANAYYNLSAVYLAKNDFETAKLAMNKVLSLVEKDSTDYKTVKADLESLEKKQKDLTEATNSGNLTTPQKLQPAIEPQLKLSEEASPPAGPRLLSPSPTATP